jgi:phosphatidate cytidylyltransferase
MDADLKFLIYGVVSLLAFASTVSFVLKKIIGANKLINNLNSRVNAWWMMCFVFFIAILTGGIASIILFSLVSFMALREFITMAPTNKGDHRTLFWAFFVALPVQYIFVAIDWYGMFAIWIPVYCFLFIPIRNALSGETTRFLERTAKIQWGLMICVYCVSHVPMLLNTVVKDLDNGPIKMLFFFVLIVQLNDVFQYIWGNILGKHKVIPKISPNKTWEGLIGGILSTSILGGALWWVTPFGTPYQAGFMAMIIATMGFFGDIVMSAIKRDRGIKDFSATIAGHGGILDRIDSLCFAAPIFFHFTRYFFLDYA